MTRVGHCRRRNEITPPHLDCIQAEPLSDGVHQPFAHKRALKASRRAISAARRLVGQANAPDHAIGVNTIRPEQHGGSEIRDRRGMRTHIGTLIVKEFAVDAEQAPGFIDGSADTIMLFAGMIGGDEVFAPILDPFHRAAEPERGDTDEHVFGIKFAAHAEAAAGMAFMKMNRRGGAPEHARERITIPMRDFRRAVKFEHVAGGIVARNGAARFQRHARVPASFEFECHGCVSRSECRGNIAVTLPHRRGFAGTAGGKFAGRRVSLHQFGQFLDVDNDEIGRVFSAIGVSREDDRDGLADIADAILGQDRLPIRFEPFNPRQPEIDRRNMGDVRPGPGRDDACGRERSGSIDRDDPAMRMGRTHQAHMQLVGK
jgi:hypothetical protein